MTEADEYNDLLTRATSYLPVENGDDHGSVEYGQVVMSPYPEVRAKALRYLRGLPDLPPLGDPSDENPNANDRSDPDASS